MTIVVKLGGTNGSGKTSVAKALLNMMKDKYATDSKDVDHNLPAPCKVAYYTGRLDRKMWSVLGDYRNVCGGMDTISDKLERLKLVRYVAEKHADVTFFEGLITGKTYGAFGAMSEEPQHKGRWIYAFMDTPFEVCVERVKARRYAAARAKGLPQPPLLDAERTMRPTYKSVQAVAKRAAVQGHKVVWLPHKLKPEHIAQYLVNEVEEFANACR